MDAAEEWLRLDGGGKVVRIKRVVTEGHWDRPDRGVASGSGSGSWLSGLLSLIFRILGPGDRLPVRVAEDGGVVISSSRGRFKLGLTLVVSLQWPP